MLVFQKSEGSLSDGIESRIALSVVNNQKRYRQSFQVMRSFRSRRRNESFRGYADYMQTEEFHEAFAQLAAIADDGKTAIMCAEAVL